MRQARRWFGILAATAALAVLGAACAPGGGQAPSAASCGMDATSQGILYDLNVARTQNGLPGLAANGQLTCLAQGWSAYLASTNSFYHRDLAGVLRSPGYGGYHTLGENILRGPAGMSAADMNTAWWNSPDHRANMLSPSFTSVGIGLAYINGQVWATEDFGG
jgi:uncharacterized protein YkwD